MTATLTEPLPVPDIRTPERDGHRTGRAAAVWIALVVVARAWGLRVVDDAGEALHIGAVPFFGSWQWVITPRLLAPLTVAVLGVLILPTIAARWSWRAVLAMVAATAIAWGLALGFADPSSGRWSSIHADYGTHIELVDQQGPGGFLRDYVDHQATFPTHLQAHPPGMVMLLWLGRPLGLASNAGQVGLALAGCALGAVAALTAAREVAGERFARRAAPFVVLAPAAVWHTNADVVFAGLAVAAVAAVVVATGRHGRASLLLAAAGGALFGAALLLSYGVALLVVPMVFIAVGRRAARTLACAGIVAAAILALPGAWGFVWLDGVAATKHQYDLNLAQVRPYGYFLFANLAVFATAIGPAVAAGVGTLRDRRAWVLIGAGLAAVTLADLTGLSLAETERIWQPFMPLVLLAGAAVATSRRSMQWWLGVQVAVALALQTGLRSPW